MATTGAMSVSIKGKINNLEQTVIDLNDDIIFTKKEIPKLRAEKEILDNTIVKKHSEIRETLSVEILKEAERMKNLYIAQKNENVLV